MSIAVTLNPTTFKALQTTTMSFTGLTPTTTYTLTVTNPQGHVTVISKASDGSGNMTMAYTPQLGGSHSVSFSHVVVDGAGGTFQSGGHN